ncbi:MAG TPA: nucleotidyltransferase family protein [Candidatus Limnocylindrales bacterium]|nr:nucleotidyltransferase family protein [Candidatus Limnocylindrales bacterium]
MSNEIRAMVLAAGRGERLRPLTDTVPKPLVNVGGKPLIEYALECVASAGIGRVVVNLHHLGDQIRDHLGDGARFGLAIDYSPENPLQDTGGGIRDARRLLGDCTFVTLNSDTIVDVDLRAVIDFHLARRAAATLVLQKHDRMEQFGLIRTEPDGRIGAFLQHVRPNAQHPLEPFMYTGVQVLEPVVFDYMPPSEPFSITRVTYPQMLVAEQPMYGYRFDGTWITVGTPQELAEAAALLGMRSGGAWTTQSVEM